MPSHVSSAGNRPLLYPRSVKPTLTGSMAARMPLPALVVLAIVLLCIPAPTIAADFTSGMTIDSYKYFFNVTSYANVSMDVKDMHTWIDASNYAEAQKIYINGKNAWRSLTSVPPNPRNAQPVISRNYTTSAGFAEPWWLISVTYYNEIVSGGVVNPNLYLDKLISDALSGTSDYAPTGQFSPYRAEMLKAYLTFYPTLYYSHEMDAGYTALMANPSAVRTGHSETDHGVGCYTGVTPASTETTTVRVAPGFTPWEVSEQVASFFCTEKELRKGTPAVKVKTSAVNVEFIKISKDVQNLFAPGGVQGLVTSVSPSQLLVLRNKQLKNVNINQIQLTLRAAYNAANAALCKNDNKPCLPAKYGGEAYAHWRMAQPALSFLGVSKGNLQTIEALLNPNVWKAAAAESSAILRKHLKQVVTEIKQASLQAGYLWGSQIAGCKLGNTDISSLSVGGAAAATAASEVVAAADVLVDVAAASAAVAEPTPAAAAMAALMATPANPAGIVVDANALLVDADGLEEAP